ncbi:MAG: metallophosphoesterase family protein [Planctomycetota bacterium]|nr:metallophosphoesterase family protein [Planctomycetota bacterium]
MIRNQPMASPGIEVIRPFCMLVLALVCLDVGRVAAAEIGYSDWKDRCLKTPSNRTLRGRFPSKDQLPLKEFRVVQQLVEKLFVQTRQAAIAQPSNWVGEKPVREEFFDTRRAYFMRSAIRFQPFAQKLVAEPGSELIFHGDFHGDIRSFISTLEWLNRSGRMSGFQIKRPNTYMVFLGDYTDRGAYGVEVIYTLLRLKLANPHRVFFVRGNHEDFQLTARYGFLKEVQTKYGRDTMPLSIWRMYDFLPVVIYAGVGDDYVQCNHGGMEPGFDPRPLLNATGPRKFRMLGELSRAKFLSEHPDWLTTPDAKLKRLLDARMVDFRPRSPTVPATIGFMWSDYSVFADDPALSFDPRRGAFVFGRSATRYLLGHASGGRAKLRSVFRAHQHSSVPNAMTNRLIASKGSFRHWQVADGRRRATNTKAELKSVVETKRQRSVPDRSVWTLNVAPDSLYGVGNSYAFDTIGILKTARSFSDWRLEVVNVPVKVE